MTVELIVRTSVILGVTWVIARCLTRATPAARHLLWHVAVVAVVLAPLVSPLVPRLEVLPPVVESLSRRSALEPSARRRMPPERRWMHQVQEVQVQRVQAVPQVQEVQQVREVRTAAIDGWRSLAPAMWVAGSVLLGLYFLMGHLRAGVLTRRSQIAPPVWQEEAARLATSLGIRRYVSVRVLREPGTPLALGVVRASILLPPSAYDWSAARRRGVLLHELAHVQRGDCRAQAVAQAACALYWFNPLVWIAARALGRERERACDAEVLRNGTPASSYAADLLELARSVRGARTPAGAVAMARPHELEGRLLAILSDSVGRVPSRSAKWSIAALVFLTSVVTLGASPVRGSMPVAKPAKDIAAAPQPRPLLTPEPTVLERDRNKETITKSLRTLRNAPDADDRETAVMALLGSGDEATIRPLMQALQDPSSQVREKAALGLGLLSSPDVIEPLIAALRDPDSQVREKAAVGLALRRDARVIGPLIAAMADGDSQVREKAAIALGTSGDARATHALEQALNDPDPQVREKAVSGLVLLRTSSPANSDMIRSGLRTVVNGVVGLMR
jgi:beta-lactamase regulating signal transducer with metallopeptidase domain